MKNLYIPLAGVYQPKNAAVSLTALNVLKSLGWAISDEAVRCGLERVKWCGRFEILRRSPVFILEGAHNPHGISAAADSLRKYFGEKKIVFLIGVMADKDLDGMIPNVLPLAKCFVAVRPLVPRAMDEDELRDRLLKFGARAVSCAAIEDGVSRAVEEAGDDGVVCALGSLYFSGDVRAAVEKIMPE